MHAGSRRPTRKIIENVVLAPLRCGNLRNQSSDRFGRLWPTWLGRDGSGADIRKKSSRRIRRPKVHSTLAITNAHGREGSKGGLRQVFEGPREPVSFFWRLFDGVSCLGERAREVEYRVYVGRSRRQ